MTQRPDRADTGQRQRLDRAFNPAAVDGVIGVDECQHVTAGAAYGLVADSRHRAVTGREHLRARGGCHLH